MIGSKGKAWIAYAAVRSLSGCSYRLKAYLYNDSNNSPDIDKSLATTHYTGRWQRRPIDAFVLLRYHPLPTADAASSLARSPLVDTSSAIQMCNSSAQCTHSVSIPH